MSSHIKQVQKGPVGHVVERWPKRVTTSYSSAEMHENNHRQFQAPALILCLLMYNLFVKKMLTMCIHFVSCYDPGLSLQVNWDFCLPTPSWLSASTAVAEECINRVVGFVVDFGISHPTVVYE